LFSSNGLHGRTAQPRGGPGCAKDPTDDPAELHVLCAVVMTFDGTCERMGVQRAPKTPWNIGEWGEAPGQL
jgi:hypothetical protein